MEEVKVSFLSDNKFEVSTVSSQVKFYIDKKAEDYIPRGPAPIELLLSSLAGCIGVFARSYLRRHSLEFSRLNINASAQLSQDSPKRLVDIKVDVDTDAELGGKREVFLRFIQACPIHNTICHDSRVNISLV